MGVSVEIFVNVPRKKVIMSGNPRRIVCNK